MKLPKIQDTWISRHKPEFTIEAMKRFVKLRRINPNAEVHDLLGKLKISRDDLVKKLAEDLKLSLAEAATIIDGDTLSIFSDKGKGNKELNRRIGPTLNILNFAPPRDYGLECEVVREALNQYHMGTANHSLRVTGAVIKIASHLGLKMDEDLLLAANWHDIGKIAIPDEVLTKPAKLIMPESEVMELHQSIGYLLLRGIKRYRQVAEIMLFTHIENGYPREVAEKVKQGTMQVPTLSHFLIIADTFDACTSYREYRQGARMSMREIFETVVIKHDRPRHPLWLLIATAQAFEINPEDAKKLLASVFTEANEIRQIENSFRS